MALPNRHHNLLKRRLSADITTISCVYLNRCPVELADFLFSDGIISREEKESIAASTGGEHQQAKLLGALLQAILETSKASATMRSLRRAFETARLNTYYIKKMEDFVDG